MSDPVDRLLPPPPIPGGQHLVHLSTPRMLAQEAREQRVVFDDVGEYEKGCHCAYRVIAPVVSRQVVEIPSAHS